MAFHIVWTFLRLVNAPGNKHTLVQLLATALDHFCFR